VAFGWGFPLGVGTSACQGAIMFGVSRSFGNPKGIEHFRAPGEVNLSIPEYIYVRVFGSGVSELEYVQS
jgi:hypothetical protein